MHVLFIIISVGFLNIVKSYTNEWRSEYGYPTPSPQEIMVDSVNYIGLVLLGAHNENNNNNMALSPYGVTSVLVVLNEGLEGKALNEILEATLLPLDIDVIRIGLRDIHRHLKSYFIPREGFLGGLTFNCDNVTLKPHYENILKFYGFNVEEFNIDFFSNLSSTHVTTSTSNNVHSTTKQQSTTTTTQIIASTTKEITTTEYGQSAEISTSTPTTVLATDSTSIISTATTSTSNAIIETRETTSTISEATAKPKSEEMELIETLSTATVSDVTTTVLATPQTGTTTTTQPTELTATTIGSTGITFTTVTDSITTAVNYTSTATTPFSTDSSTFSSLYTATGSTLTFDASSTSIPTTTNFITADTEPFNATDDSTTTSVSPPTTITEMITSTTTKSTVTASNADVQSTTEPIETAPTSDQSVATNSPEDFIITSSTTIESNLESTNPVDTTFDTSAESESDTSIRRKKNAFLNVFATLKLRPAVEFVGYKSNKRPSRSFKDYHIAKYYDSSAPSHIITRYEPTNPSSFFVADKVREPNINFVTYDTVLPFRYISYLNALAITFPLDSDKYYLLLLLPIDEAGINNLVDNMMSTTLKQIIYNLQPTRVKATIPNFRLKGFTILTPTLQKLGIKSIFEPRRADFSKMTDSKNIYVTNVEQAITVTIRNYVNSTNPFRNEIHQRRGPVIFNADHPFLYFVMDSDIHVTLVAGKVVNPLNSRIS
ncbi:hypothetical protein FQA39_LY06778 [Lamprigera yunnana]|nr:hypothetical protein FQA39_LY06778 [Lamprigera yunnana]